MGTSLPWTSKRRATDGAGDGSPTKPPGASGNTGMTQLLHATPGSSSFDVRRQVGELDNIVGTRAGRLYLAEQYTGWPHR